MPEKNIITIGRDIVNGYKLATASPYAEKLIVTHESNPEMLDYCLKKSLYRDEKPLRNSFLDPVYLEFQTPISKDMERILFRHEDELPVLVLNEYISLEFLTHYSTRSEYKPRMIVAVSDQTPIDLLGFLRELSHSEKPSVNILVYLTNCTKLEVLDYLDPSFVCLSANSAEAASNITSSQVYISSDIDAKSLRALSKTVDTIYCSSNLTPQLLTALPEHIKTMFTDDLGQNEYFLFNLPSSVEMLKISGYRLTICREDREDEEICHLDLEECKERYRAIPLTVSIIDDATARFCNEFNYPPYLSEEYFISTIRAREYCIRALLMLLQKKWQDVISAANNALKYDPEYFYAFELLTKGYLGQGNYKKAQEYLSEYYKRTAKFYCNTLTLYDRAQLFVLKNEITIANNGSVERIANKLSLDGDEISPLEKLSATMQQPFTGISHLSKLSFLADKINQVHNLREGEINPPHSKKRRMSI